MFNSWLCSRKFYNFNYGSGTQFANSFKRNFIDSNANVRSKDKFFPLYEQQLSKYKKQFYQCFTVEEINSALIKLKSDIAPGSDCVTPEHVKYAGYASSSVLCRLLNMCLMHGYVPESFTISIMVPVPKDKSGNCSNVSNYRPISLITMFSKIFEIY